MPADEATLHRWDDVPGEDVAAGIRRRYISGCRAMVARLELRKGARVAWHSHDNEQLTYVVDGALRFWIGDEETVFEVRAGEVLRISADVPHRVEALEDTIDIDVFSPPRQDWIDKTDDYFRR